MLRLKLVIPALSACLMFPVIVHAQCSVGNPFCRPLSVFPTTVVEGQPVTIDVELFNSTPQELFVRRTVEIIPSASACAAFAESFTASGEVPPDEEILVHHTLHAPNCVSTYNVLLLGIPRASAAFTVIPACSAASPGFTPSLSVAPTTAEEGEPVTITVGVISCFSSAKVFTANVNITPTSSSCASSASAFQVSGIIQPDQTATFTHTFPAPKCSSTYDVKMPGAKTATLNVVPTSGLTLKVTSPLNNSTVTNPVHIAAMASDPNPISQIEVWVNYKEVFHVSGGTLNADVTLPVGSDERFVVQAVDSKGNIAKVVYSITVK